MAEIAVEKTTESTLAPSRSSLVQEEQSRDNSEVRLYEQEAKPDDAEAQQAVQAPAPDFPEGGLRGWATVAGAYVGPNILCSS